MQTKAVEKLPTCTQCIATDRTPPNDASFEVINPMNMKERLCDEHFFDYIVKRLGTNTVSQFVLTQRAGGHQKAR